MEINITIARKVLQTVDSGLCQGMGSPVPGEMCVEAAVCYAMGLEHSDEPTCVSPALRRLKIRLNDSNWSSNTTRSKGLRRLALAQLGSAGNLDEIEFARRCTKLAIKTSLAEAIRVAAALQKDEAKKQLMLKAADRCEQDPSKENAKEARYAAAAAAATAAYARSVTRDRMLAAFCEGVVQILIEMKAPGCEWLSLTE